MSQMVPLGNPLIVTMGMGQEGLLEPAMAAAGTIEYFIIVDAVKKALRGDGAEPLLDDDINVYKIIALLTEVNRQPLANPLYNKMTRLIIEKKVQIDAELVEQKARKSEPYRIVIGEHRIIRETDE
jgi:hypothetical protein